MRKHPNTLLRTARVRALCHARGRRIGGAFQAALERHVERKIDAACRVHNGGRVTLDAAVANFVGMPPA